MNKPTVKLDYADPSIPREPRDPSVAQHLTPLIGMAIAVFTFLLMFGVVSMLVAGFVGWRFF